MENTADFNKNMNTLAPGFAGVIVFNLDYVYNQLICARVTQATGREWTFAF